MKRVQLKTGDVLQIPLADRTFVLAQIVLLDLSKGAPLNPIIRVVNGFYQMAEKPIIDQIDLTDQLFPPVIVSVRAAVSEGIWHRVGNADVKNFKYPQFLSTYYSELTGKAGVWYLIDGNCAYKIGLTIPESYKELEFRVVLSPFDVMERIRTRNVTFPFGELIKHNKFTPLGQSKAVSLEEKKAFRRRMSVKKGGGF